MANTTYDTIKSMKPAAWSKSTVADGNALNQNFLEPTHQKDLTLAAAIDQVKNTVDEYNEVINDINDIADAAQHQAQEAENSVNEMSDTLNEHGTAIENLDTNLNTVSAGLVAAAESIAALETNKQDKIYVDPTTIAGNGSHDNPYTVIGGGGGGGSNNVYVPNVDSEGNLKYDISATSASQAHVGPWNIKGPQGEPGIGLSADSEDSLEARHTRVRIWEKGAETYDTQFDLPWGQNGYDPEITLDTIPASTDPNAEHKNGGTKVTIVYGYYGSQTATYSAWNGNDGSMAGAPDIEGDNGISASYNGSKYFVGLSGDVYVPSLSAGSANKAGYSELAGSATYAEKFKVNNTDYTFSNLYSEVDTLSNASGRWNAHSALSATKLDKSIWDNNSGKFVTSASTDFQTNGQYGIIKDNDGIHWGEIQGGSSFTGVETDTTTLSGTGLTNSPIGITKTKKDNWDSAYGVSEAYKAASGKFVTSAAADFPNAGQYGIIKDTNGIHWGEIQGGVTVYDIVGNNGVSAEKDTANNQYIVGLSGRYVNVSGDTMTGPLVVNSTTNHPIVGISQRGDSDDFAVFGATRKKSNNNFGTTWLGVGSSGQGVLKNIPNTSTSASTEPETNGAYTQITFSQNNNAVPSVDINAKLNGSDHNYKSVVVPQQSYNSMSAFDATNGPNYMLRKLSDGSFDIGACVINVTEVPTATEANTYYFVYDIV